MKFSVFISSAALVRQVVASRWPDLQWDPETVKDCIEWYNNGFDVPCEDVRKSFGISPQLFHEWNPMVGLDCKPWDFQSYCVLTQEYWDSRPISTSSSVISTTTTTAFTLAPSPTSWIDKGCYVEDPTLPLLDRNMSPNGDASLTIPNCKNSCYRHAYEIVGVQEGNQCWCGTYIGGLWAKNQTDCNIPCTGDKTTNCGGKGLLNIFRAEKNKTPTSTVFSGSGSTSATVARASHTSGANKNRVML